MTRVLCVSSAAGVALLAAAVDAGRVGPGRRLLLVANEAAAPEVTGDPRDVPGFAGLAARFDDVLSWNELIAPLHPSTWRPPGPETPMLSRLLQARLGLAGPPAELFVESLTEGPGGALLPLLPDAPVTVVSLGLTGYAAMTRQPVTDVLERVTRLLFLDLLPGTRPHLLDQLVRFNQVDVALDGVPTADFRTAVAALRVPSGGAVVLGERWAELGVLSRADEHELHLDAVRGLVSAGHRGITFAPHPAAAPDAHVELVAAAVGLGATLTVGAAGLPHEAWLGATVLVGAAAPALLLAPHGVTVSTRRLLDALTPYDHAERLPLTVADAALPHLRPDGTVTSADPPDLSLLVDAVAFCLRAAALPALRERAVAWVYEHGARPYLNRRRLEAVGVGAAPATSPRGLVARALGRRRRGGS